MHRGSANAAGQRAVAAFEAPSLGRAVWLVALRELTDQMTSLRFLIIALLAVGLTPLAAYVGARDYIHRLGEHDRLQAEKQRQFGEGASTKITEEDVGRLRVPRPPQPLSVLVRGLDAAMPAYWDFTPGGMVSGPSASRPRRLGDVLGHLDFEFLVRVVLGLLAILLAFDSVAGEKELGTLQAVLSQPVSRAAFMSGKLLGGSITLAVPLATATGVALLSGKFCGADLMNTDSLCKVGLLFVVSVAYLVCLFALGLMISSLTSTQKTSLIVLLVTWVLAVLALPPLATLAAQAVSPAPPTYAVEAQKTAMAEQAHRDTSKQMGEVYLKIVGEEGFTATVGRGAYYDHRQAVDAAVGPILTAYLSKRRRALSELERNAERLEARQKEVSWAFMALSPAAAFASAATDLAATGDAHHTAWLEAVRRHQSRLDSVLFDNPAFITFVHPSGNAAISFGRRDSAMFSELPPFAPPRQDAAAALSRALPALGLLIAYTGVFIVGSFVAFARYDVR